MQPQDVEYVVPALTSSLLSILARDFMWTRVLSSTPMLEKEVRGGYAMTVCLSVRLPVPLVVCRNEGAALWAFVCVCALVCCSCLTHAGGVGVGAPLVALLATTARALTHALRRTELAACSRSPRRACNLRRRRRTTVARPLRPLASTLPSPFSCRLATACLTAWRPSLGSWRRAPVQCGVQRAPPLQRRGWPQASLVRGAAGAERMGVAPSRGRWRRRPALPRRWRRSCRRAKPRRTSSGTCSTSCTRERPAGMHITTTMHRAPMPLPAAVPAPTLLALAAAAAQVLGSAVRMRLTR